MRLTDIYISSLGVHLPEPLDVTEAVAAGLYEEELRVETGFERTYVAERISALDMAVAAGKQAIERSSVQPASIGYLVHGGAYYQGPPGWSATGYLMRRMELDGSPSVQITHECNGMMTGLEVAIGQMTGAAAREAVLVTAAGNFATPVIDRWHQAGPQSVLSDGAAALLLTTGNGFAEVVSINSRTLPEAEGWARGSESLLPPTEGAGWRMDLVQRAVDHAHATGESMQDWLDELAGQCRELALKSLSEAKIDLLDVRYVITFHTARYAYEDSVGDPLGIPIERSNWEFGRAIGHMGPCDHVVSLDLMLKAGAVGPGDHVLLVSWGAGMTATAVVLRILESPAWVVPTGALT